MSIQTLMKRLRVLVVCAGLEFGVLVGIPMRPEQIRELMQLFNQPKLAHTLPSREEDGGKGPDPGKRPGK